MKLVVKITFKHLTWKGWVIDNGIPIYNGKKIGSLRLENVLIVPDLERRLSSVNSFLASGTNSVHLKTIIST